MFSIVPVLDDLVSHASHPVFGRGLSLMDDFKANLGFSNEVKTIEDSKKQLVLGVNCESFKPEEIKVSINKDNMLEISGNHEEKSDHSYVKRQFSRKFALPNNSIQEKMNCSLTSSGVLKISIPKDESKAVGGPVNIPIQFHK